jgi:hypothetical protein
MQRAEHYDRRAREAEERAQTLTGLVREQFLELAGQWRMLARQSRDLTADEQRRGHSAKE